MDESTKWKRKMETIRLLYANKGVTDLTEDELHQLVSQQDLRMSILGDVIRILLIVAGLLFLGWCFWPK